MEFYRENIQLHCNSHIFSLLVDVVSWRFEVYLGRSDHYIRLRIMQLPHPKATWYETKWQWLH